MSFGMHWKNISLLINVIYILLLISIATICLVFCSQHNHFPSIIILPLIRPTTPIDPLIILWGDNYTLCTLPNGNIDMCITCCLRTLNLFCNKQQIHKQHITSQYSLGCAGNASFKWENYADAVWNTAESDFCVVSSEEVWHVYKTKTHFDSMMEQTTKY